MTAYAQYWNHHEPRAIADGQVTIQARDLFSPQTVSDADIFLLRNVLHIVSDTEANEILKRLKESAVPGKTKVVVIDGVIQYACAVDQKTIRGADDIVFEGLDKKSKVAGLLSNLGRAEARNYYLDFVCGLLPHWVIGCSLFLTNIQDVGDAQYARPYPGRVHSDDGSRRVENSEDIFSRRKENQLCSC